VSSGFLNIGLDLTALLGGAGRVQRLTRLSLNEGSLIHHKVFESPWECAGTGGLSRESLDSAGTAGIFG